MPWRKLGLAFSTPDPLPPGSTHAMLPTPVVLGDRIRVYFTVRDSAGRGRPFFVELDARDPMRLVRGPIGPLLELGDAGTFDRDGVALTSIVHTRDSWLLYYTGFELGTQTPYRLLSGLAISRDAGETCERVSRTPVLERTDQERQFRCAPFVWQDGDRYRMLYIAGSDWTEVSGKKVPVYNLRSSESPDGVHWPAVGHVEMTLTDPDEHGFGRPWLMRDQDRLRLFFSVRKRSLAAYRLAYAEAAHGGQWIRDDANAITVSPSGWDSQAVLYSAVVDANGRRLCFYNGNEFGRDGFGVAVLES